MKKSTKKIILEGINEIEDAGGLNNPDIAKSIKKLKKAVQDDDKSKK